jgi:cytochrome c oxidase subunit 2
MNSLIDLHHDIMFFLLIIFGVVSYLLFIILNEHKVSEFYFDTVPSNVVHNTTLELLWTTLPSLVLFVIAIPSFSLLYILEELKQPDVVLKVIGHQ